MAFLLSAMVVMSLTAFLVSGAHRRRTERVAQAGTSALLPTPLMEYGLWVLQPAVRTATSWGLSADLLSWASLAFHGLAAAALARGDFGWAAAGLLVGGSCDSLDGAVARALGSASEAGEVLDAVVDRWSEMAVLFGLAYGLRDLPWGFWLSLWAAAGSVMVSYTRAKSQAMRVPAAGGLMQRHERATYLMLGVLLSALLQRLAPAFALWPLFIALFLIASLSTAASLQRTVTLRAALRPRA